MKMKAIQIIQNGRKIYLTYITAKDLASNIKTKIDVYSSKNSEGYQREPTKSRIKQVARFLLSEKGIIPASALISIRGKLSFKEEGGSAGTLTINEDEIFWQVDGQHRLAGLIEAIKLNPELEKFEMPLIIINPSSWEKEIQNPQFMEAYQFYVINKTQKGVRSDLAEQFLARLFKEEKNIENIVKLPNIITRGIEWVPSAIQISEILNKGKTMWQGRICPPNEPKGQTIINQKSFTDSLKPILTHDNFKQYTVEEMAELLKRYWQAISEFMPEVFEFPKDYVIQKTTGPFVLHKLFPDVTSYCPKKLLTKDNLKDVLKGLKEGISAEFWSNNGVAGLAGTNKKAFSLLEKKLRANLIKSHRDLKPNRPFEL